MNKIPSLVIILLFLIASFPLTAQEKESKSSFTFSSNRTEAVLARGKEHTILQGNAAIVTDTKEIRADRIDIYGDDFGYAVCTGNIRVIDRENETTLTCQSLKYDRNSETIIVEGYSEMEDRKNELVTKSGFIEDKGNEKFTILQIGVRILKIADNEEMSCRSEYAGYDREDNILELTGMPRVYWKGDEYAASRIIIDLDTDEIKMEGNVSGSITTE
jgi:lipopolysaccharide export system protein LptA